MKPKPITKNLSLLRIGGDAKTTKGQGQGVLTGILYLAPDLNSGHKTSTCPFASKECSSACLYSAGRGKMSNVQNARKRKTLEYFKNRKNFIDRLKVDITKGLKFADKHKMKLAIRFNGTSDLPFEKFFPMEEFPRVTFYDYTKNPVRMEKFTKGEMPKNYHLTFSRSENNQESVKETLDNGGNVAVVFSTRKGETLPKSWQGKRVIDGDKTDIRFNDPRNVIVGLRAKGDAMGTETETGFVVKV